MKGIGKPKLHSFGIFHVFGYSQLQFVAQLRAPCKGLRRVELQTITDFIGGPGLWAPADLFYTLKLNKMFPKDLKAFDTLCRAAMLKTAVQTLPDWRDVYKELNIEQRNPDGNIFFPFKAWWEGLSVVTLKRAVDAFDSREFARSLGESTFTLDLDLQKKFYDFSLPQMHPLRFENALRAKLARWFEGDALDSAVAQARRVLNKIAQTAPPCVLFCLLCTWCNAWCTSQRFQNKDGACWLCQDCQGPDSMEHYAECPYQWIVAMKKLNMQKQPSTLLQFLGLDPSALPGS